MDRDIHTTVDDSGADEIEATQPVNRASLPSRRPAELTTFVGSLVGIAGALGLDLSTEVVAGGFAALGLLPGIVSHYVGVYRDAISEL